MRNERIGGKRMSVLEVRDIDACSEYFVGTSSHVGESEEIDACARKRVAWLRQMYDRGLRAKVAMLEGNPVGFIYVMPIGICPWGPIGQGLAVVPCLWVLNEVRGRGIGSRLLAAAEDDARQQGRTGIAAVAYQHDFWFMPVSFFEICGFSHAKRRAKEVIVWKIFDSSAEAPRFLERNYHFRPVEGKVVLDLFWNTFCQTSLVEAQRVREVAAEFEDSVVLKEYCADDRATFCLHQIPRGIFVNGKEIGWGYEAPKDGMRAAIRQAESAVAGLAKR